MRYLLFSISIIFALLAGSFCSAQDSSGTRKSPSVNHKNYSYQKSSDTKLSESMKSYLGNVIKFLKENPDHKVYVIGHSDDAGTIEENIERSKKRADEVKNYLLKNGISDKRLITEGRGSLEPVAENTSEAGRKKNRRVEIEVIPPGADDPIDKNPIKIPKK